MPIDSPKTKPLSNTFEIILPHIFVISSIVLSRAISYMQNLGIYQNLSILLICLGLVPAFILLKFDGKVPIVYSLILFVLEIILGYYMSGTNMSRQLFIYLLLFAGTVINAIQYVRRTRGLEKVNSI